ncbi:hypothetical protein [Hydrogenimonas sp.]
METSGMGNASMMQAIAVDTMKKAMDIQAREVLSVLQSAAPRSMSSPATPAAVAQLTGLGQKIDVKG